MEFRAQGVAKRRDGATFTGDARRRTQTSEAKGPVDMVGLRV